MSHPTLFDSERMGLGDSIDLTIRSLEAYGSTHDHWAIAYSGGKDSSTLLTLIIHLIKSGRIARPKRLTVLYADTRMELPPLAGSALSMLDILRSEGIEARTVMAQLDRRFLVYMLGRGVPPPNNNTFRWCTRQIKVEPMQDELKRIVGETGSKVLMLTGVRVGESAQRDQRIALSCGKNGSECGQGWYQESLPKALCDTLAPILHWRTCLVWDWLSGLMPEELRHGYPTRMVAEAYGLNEEGGKAEEAARTGCNGCPLATVDLALDTLLKSAKWSYLSPLKELRPVFRWLREPAQRLRKPGFERSKDGKEKPTNRMGPLTMDARREALVRILDIQSRCNGAAVAGMPRVDMLNDEEVDRINELIRSNQWPDRWDGDEPIADEPYERVGKDGLSQRNFFVREIGAMNA